jgi:hypothetical protein
MKTPHLLSTMQASSMFKALSVLSCTTHGQLTTNYYMLSAKSAHNKPQPQKPPMKESTIFWTTAPRIPTTAFYIVPAT